MFRSFSGPVSKVSWQFASPGLVKEGNRTETWKRGSWPVSTLGAKKIWKLEGGTLFFLSFFWGGFMIFFFFAGGEG